MIGASSNSEALVQQLRLRLARIVADLAASRSARRRDWYSPRALWPDMFAGDGDGK